MLANMDTLGSTKRRILPKLALIINMYTVYCLNSTINKTDNVLTDNFLNQTLANNKRLENSRPKMEKESLTIMGLHQRPILAKINVKENSAAAFMLELYQMIHSDDGDEKAGVEPSGVNSEFNITRVPDGLGISWGSTIMSFDNDAHKLHSLPHERKNILYFDFTDVPPGVIATHAEIKIYKKRSLMHQRSHYLVEIFMRRRKTNTKDKILQPEVNLTVSKSYEGWLSFTVTDAAKYWTVNREENLGLYLRVTDLEIGPYIDPDKSGMVVEDGPKSKRIFMISYFKNPNEDHVWYARSERKRRNISPTEEVAQENNSSKNFWEINILSDDPDGWLTVFGNMNVIDFSERRNKEPVNHHPALLNSFKAIIIDPSGSATKPSEINNPDTLCRRHEMYVNFTVLGWNSWIIAPSGYHAYYCAGKCKFPLADHLNPTVHAILQTFVHDTDPAKTTRVCCVPTKMAPLSILYAYGEQSVKFEPYQNMIVETCGCR